MLFNKKSNAENKDVLKNAIKNNGDNTNKRVNSKPLSEKQKEKQLACEKFKNVDFSKVSKEKMFLILSELLIENRTLSEEVNKLYEENKEYTNSLKDGRNREKDIEGKIMHIAQKICPQLIIEMNKGVKYTLEGKVNMIIENVLSEKKKNLQKIITLNEDILKQKQVLNQLKSQLTERIQYQNEATSHEQTEFTEKDFELLAGKDTSEKAIPNISSSSEQAIVLKSVDMSKVKSSIDKTSEIILEAIGKFGISEYPELQNYCIKKGTNITESKFETAIENLKSNAVVEYELVTSFAKSRGVRIYNLTNEVGKILFKEIFKQIPIISEKEKIKRENDNLIHGYSIKDCSNLLEAFGYTEISMDRNKNTIKIDGAKTWVPDIIAINPISGRKEYFEIEMGTHNIENFNNKMDKANLKASILKIICPNKQIKNALIQKVDNWKAKNLKSASTITISVLTFGEFRNKEDGYVFNGRKPVTLNEIANFKEEIIITKENK